MATTLVTPTTFTFQALQTQQLSWTLADQNNNPITGATVKATLYSNRSRFTPTVSPGVADSVFNNLTLTETPAASGIYVTLIPESFNPSPALINFITVITGVDSGNNQIGVWEIPTVVVPEQRNIDLVSLSDVKSWMGFDPSNTSCDSIIQLIITSFSQYVLNRTGIQSFKQVSQYTDVYDGNGNSRLFLDNRPILSLLSVIIGSYTVPLSTSLVNPGIFIERGGLSIAFRDPGWSLTAPLSLYPYRFLRGTGNVQVTYTAGYNAVPYDLQEIVIEIVAQNYKRKDWIDLASKNISTPGAAGSTVYRSWALTPMAERVINYYSRYRTA